MRWRFARPSSPARDACSPPGRNNDCSERVSVISLVPIPMDELAFFFLLPRQTRVYDHDMR